MRLYPLILCAALPAMAWAEDFTLTSQIGDVTVYPMGAKVVRLARFEIPAGDHRLRVPDLPESAILDMLRASVTGATMGAVTVRGDYVPPREVKESPAVAEARAELARRTEALMTRRDDAAALRLASEAAETRIAFLRQLGQSAATEGASPGALRDIARMVGDETLEARQAVIQAEAEARAVDIEIRELERAVAKAEQALQALMPDSGPRNMVEVAVTAAAPVEGVLQVTYYTTEATWEPVNDAFLTLGGTPDLTVQRGALVRQDTGENWSGVTLTLSTNRPSGQVGPSTLWPELRRIVDPMPPSSRYAGAAKEADAPSPEPVVVVEADSRSLEGLIFTHTFPAPVSIAPGADGLRLSLGSVRFMSEVRAVAIPRQDETAYLTAEYTNVSGELLLPSEITQLYLEGEFVGTTRTDMLAAGQDSALSFGPIEGLRLSRVERQNEGDRGIISKTSQQEVEARIEVQNLTGRSWPMRVIDRVPYSQQEDLVISWSAQPAPARTDLDDQQGILAWEFELPAGKTQDIRLTHKLQWPSDKVLR